MNKQLIAGELVKLAKNLTAGDKVIFKPKVVGEDVELHVIVKLDDEQGKHIGGVIYDAEQEAERRLTRANGQNDWHKIVKHWTTTKDGIVKIYVSEWAAESDGGRDHIKALK
jgi:hypothetical protein